MGLPYDFHRTVQLLLFLHIVIFFFCHTPADFGLASVPALWMLAGIFAGVRRSPLLLSVWGFITGLYVSFLFFVTAMDVPRQVSMIIITMTRSYEPLADLGIIVLACIVWLLYCTVSAWSVVLAFRLRAHLIWRRCRRCGQRARTELDMEEGTKGKEAQPFTQQVATETNCPPQEKGKFAVYVMIPRSLPPEQV